MRRFYVAIKDQSFRSLVDLAAEERRAPRAQAALLLERALHASSVLRGDRGEVGTRAAEAVNAA